MEEAATLREVLARYVSDLRKEIADTDSLDFRDQLERKKEFLNKLLQQLGGEQEPQGESR